MTFKNLSVRLGCLALLAVLTGTAACSGDPERAKQEYLKSGNQYFDQEKYSEAIVQYRNALQQDAKFGEARFKLAQAYERIGDSVNATREYIRAADALPDRADAQVKAGAYLLFGGQSQEARVRAEKALKLDPRNVEAQIILGNALAGLKDIEGALRQVEEAVKLDPASSTALSSLGALRLAHGDQQEAEAAFRKAVEVGPDSPQAHLALAYFLWASGRQQDAEASFKRAVEVDPSNLTSHRALALYYLGSGRAALAEPHFKAMAAADTSASAPYKLALADYYIALNRTEDASAVLAGLVNAKDTASAAQTRVAAIDYVTKSRADGNRVIDQVLAKDPKNVPALLAKTRFQIEQGQIDGALATAQKAVAADGQSVPARYLLGTIYRAKRMQDEAVRAFSEVLKINPAAAAAQVQLAQLSLERGETARAVQLASDAARLLPNDARAQFTLMRSLMASAQYQEAARISAAMVRTFPKLPEVHAAAGSLALATNDRAGARRAFEKALEIDGANIEALMGLVRLDMSDKRAGDALARIDQQLAKTPRNAELLLLAARVHGASGDTEKAESHLTKAIEADPNNLSAYLLLGQLYQARGRIDQARASFEAVLKRQPNSVGANTVVAVLYEIEGNLDEARKRYEQVMQLDPNAPVAANNLAYLYAEHGGNLDVALQLAQTAKQHLPDEPQVSDTLGWIYVKKELASIGLPQLEDAVRRSPQDAQMHYHLGVALAKTGDAERSRRTLERALTLKLQPPLDAEARRLMATL